MALSDQILGKKWCDMLFEGRNKEYGAYKIRKETGQRYTKALGCLGSMLILFTAPIVTLMIIFATPPQIYDIGDTITRFEGVRIKEARPQRRPEKKSDPEMSDKAEPKVEDTDPVADMLTVKQDEPVEPDKIEDLSKDSLNVLLKEAKLELALDDERTDGVIVDTIPRYPGGIASFMKWLDSTMVYPPACVRQKVQGSVTVAFIVDTDGTTKDPRIIKGANRMLNGEALRVISLMRPWRPARKYGKPIRAQVTIPIVFELE